ncbi:MAG: hypothetical protein ACTSVZ_12210 [Promethearchaeota archaeon]
MVIDLKTVKINGQTINSIKKALLSEKLASKFIIEAVGEEVKDDEYYPADGFLRALNSIGEKMNVVILKKVGTKIMESAQWPPGVDSLESALKSISVAYKMNHRPNDTAIIGDYIYNKLSDEACTITATNPYPCDFDEGIVEGVAKSFETNIFIEHVEGSCRKNGDSKCVYLIKKALVNISKF